MSVQPAGAVIAGVPPLGEAKMFAIITLPSTTPAGLEIVTAVLLPDADAAPTNVGALLPEEVVTVVVAGLRARRCATAYPALTTVVVFAPVAPATSCIASAISTDACEVLLPVPVDWVLVSSVMPLPIVKLV